MSPSSIVLLAVGLAMDAAAVSAARGLRAPRVRLGDAVLVAALFGGFQAAMPLVGWMAGASVGPHVEAWDHWIAFVLLAGIGGHMIRGSSHEEREEERRAGEPFRPGVLVALAVATSIDALAVGITLPMLGAPLVPTLVTIGLVTSTLSAAALFAGRHLGARLGPSLDLVGGVVLVGLGIKIVVQHLVAP